MTLVEKQKKENSVSEVKEEEFHETGKDLLQLLISDDFNTYNYSFSLEENVSIESGIA